MLARPSALPSRLRRLRSPLGPIRSKSAPPNSNRLVLCFHTTTHSFAPRKTLSPLFSSRSSLFGQNTWEEVQVPCRNPLRATLVHAQQRPQLLSPLCFTSQFPVYRGVARQPSTPTQTRHGRSAPTPVPSVVCAQFPSHRGAAYTLLPPFKLYLNCFALTASRLGGPHALAAWSFARRSSTRHSPRRLRFGPLVSGCGLSTVGLHLFSPRLRHANSYATVTPEP